MEENGPVESTKEAEHQWNQDAGEGIYPERQELSRSGLGLDVEHGDTGFAAVAQLEVVIATVVQFLLAEHVCVPVDSRSWARVPPLLHRLTKRQKREKSTQN